MRYFIVAVFLMSFFSCEKKDTLLKTFLSEIKSSIDIYPDSSYFSEIVSMQYVNGKVYALDVKRCDIAVLSDDLKHVDFIGTAGRGPNELLDPLSLYVFNDTVSVVNGGSISIKKFYNNVFIEDKKLEIIPSARQKFYNRLRFFQTDSCYYIPSVSEKGSFFTIPAGNLSIEYRGMIEDRGNETRTMVQNDRRLLYHESGFFAVPEALPFIEKYDLKSCELVEKIDLSECEIYQRNLEFIKSKGPGPDKSYYVLAKDCYVEGNDIFILCNTLGTDYKSNKLLVISMLPKMEIRGAYELPSEIYRSICVSRTDIYAFNSQSCTIEIIPRSDE